MGPIKSTIKKKAKDPLSVPLAQRLKELQQRKRSGEYSLPFDKLTADFNNLVLAHEDNEERKYGVNRKG